MKVLFAFLLVFGSTQLLAEHSVLSGHVMGHDGKPMQRAMVSVYRFGADKADTIADVSTTGGFSLNFWRQGVYRVQFNGLNHEQWNMPFIVDHVVREDVDVQLANTILPQRIDSVMILGAFNNFNRTAGRRMTLKDGTYRIATPNPSPRFEWQVLICGDQLPASQGVVASNPKGEDFRVHNGQFAAVQNSIGLPELQFDPSAISTVKSALKVTCANKQLQQFCDTYTEMMQYKRNYDEAMEVAMARHMRNGGNQSNFDIKNFREFMKVSARETLIKERMKNNDDTTMERLLYVYYLTLPIANRDNMILEKTLKVLSPTSGFWALDPQLIYIPLDIQPKDKRDLYVNALLAENAHENVVVPIAYSELIQASVFGQKTRQRDLYKTIVDRFPRHPLAQAAKFYLNPDRAIQAGSKVPAFSFVQNGKDKKVSTEAFKGKYTLLDLRTDHCTGCDQRTRTLVAACQENSAKNLQVIAMGLGNSAPDIKEEQKGKINVTNGLAVKDAGVDTSELLEYVGYPWRILIGPDLNILAYGNDLDDEHCATTLHSALR